MNDTRRKRLAELEAQGNSLNDRLVALKAEYETLQTSIEEVRDEEQDYFDNMPVSLQSSDKGENATQVISDLESVIDAIGDFVNSDLPGFEELTLNL